MMRTSQYQMTSQWLECSVIKGMFSSELAVGVRRRSGSRFSTFVPKESVRGEIDSAGAVRVQVFRELGIAWAVLPSPEREIIPVLDSHLSPSLAGDDL